MQLSVVESGQKDPKTFVVGPDVQKGQTPQGLVPKDAWQSAVSTGEWSLVTCIVTPGFQFEGFELAPEGWHPMKEGS